MILARYTTGKIQLLTCHSDSVRVHDQCNNESEMRMSRIYLERISHDIPVKSQNFSENKDKDHGDEDL